MKGFRIYHDSEYFREKRYFHPDNAVADKWIKAIQEHAFYFDVTKRYERIRTLGKGKFSTVYLSRCLDGQVGDDNDELLAMKLLDKKALTPKEREFLRDEIQIIHAI
jgi:serine/threonine protein kinase